MTQVHEIVLTGGPCAGKSSALAHLAEQLGEWGVTALVVPEVATLIASAGVGHIGHLAGEKERYLSVQEEILRLQADLRARFRAIASGYPRAVILYDRAEMDGEAYVGRRAHRELLDRVGLDLVDARDGYDAVLHLVTAADGAEAHYTLANNTARAETPEQARELDRRTLAAWVGHPHIVVIDNSTDFAGKLARAAQAVADVLGIPVPRERERKFLLAGPPDAAHPDLADAVTVDIDQVYLESDDPDVEIRVRRRRQGRASVYTRTEKRSVPGEDGVLVREERETRITEREWDHLRAHQASGTRMVSKRRTCVVYRSQYLEIDAFTAPEGLVVLEAELAGDATDLELPGWCEVVREVTEERAYRNRRLAEFTSTS